MEACYGTWLQKFQNGAASLQGLLRRLIPAKQPVPWDEAAVGPSFRMSNDAERRISAKDMERQLIAAARVPPSDSNPIPPAP